MSLEMQRKSKKSNTNDAESQNVIYNNDDDDDTFFKQESQESNMEEARNYGRDSSWNQKRGVDEELDPVIDQYHSQYPLGANFEEDKDIIEILLVQKDINMPMIRSNRIIHTFDLR